MTTTTGHDPALDNAQALTISDLAHIIRDNWRPPYFGAVPYLRAMFDIETLDDRYGYDSGYDVVLYFISNAKTWRGETAKLVKAELRRRLAQH